jgi:hypothetical protein
MLFSVKFQGTRTYVEAIETQRTNLQVNKQYIQRNMLDYRFVFIFVKLVLAMSCFGFFLFLMADIWTKFNSQMTHTGTQYIYNKVINFPSQLEDNFLQS